MSSIEQTADISPAGDVAAFFVGGVVGRTFSIFGRHFLGFVLTAGAITLPYLFILLFDHQYAAIFYARNSLENNTGHAQLMNYISLVVQMIAQGAVMKAAYWDVGGEPVDFGRSIRQGLMRSAVLIGIGLMQGVGILFGLILLIAPGVILYAMWYVASCVGVIEGLGVMDSLKRSTVLTRGSRWKLLGIGLISLLVIVIFNGVLNEVVSTFANETAWAFVNYIGQAIYVPFLSVLSVVVYHDLRAAKEGLGVERISAVFD